MAILFSDGCDSFAATSDLTKKWLTATSPWAWVSNGGRNGGGCIQAATTGGSVIKTVSAGWSAQNTVCYAFWFKASAAPAAASIFLMTRSAAQATLGSLRVSTAGKFALYSSAGSLIATGSTTVTDNAWHWVELYLQTNNSSTNKLYVDGTAEWNGSFNTGTASAQDSFELTSITNITITIDDFIAWSDDVAAAPLIAALPLGPRQITTVRPQADSVVGFLTATGGSTHYNQVNEVNADGDTTYVESAVSNDQDLYDFAAMGISPATITSVVANAYVANPNPGVINFKQIAKSSSTQTDGTSLQAPSAYTIKQQSFPTDPNTSAAWANATAVDAATFGVKVV